MTKGFRLRKSHRHRNGLGRLQNNHRLRGRSEWPLRSQDHGRLYGLDFGGRGFVAPPSQGFQQFSEIPKLFTGLRLRTGRPGAVGALLGRHGIRKFLLLALAIPLHPPLREAGEDKENGDEPLHGGGLLRTGFARILGDGGAHLRIRGDVANFLVIENP
jgi:hypothetical protein